jgi:predicted urease superfamily metal-dependent hydrolase
MLHRVLQVGGTHFPVHSAVLAAHSEVLSTLLNACISSGSVIHLDAIPHQDPAVVRHMLKRMYATGLKK